MVKINIALIGSGGREDALAWKLRQSPHLDNLYILPGNRGTSTWGRNIDIAPTEVLQIVEFCKKNLVQLVVVGPELPFAYGIVEAVRTAGMLVIGPTTTAAQLELSKAFAKKTMKDVNVPTAPFAVFTDHTQALAHIHKRTMPCFVKASGIAAGKGARRCNTVDEAATVLREFMLEHTEGEAGKTVVIEDLIADGVEISTHFLCHGTLFRSTPVTMDHKLSHDGDNGSMTGGMGAVGPVPWVTRSMLSRIKKNVVSPILETMHKRGKPFTGWLYPGLMLTNSGPKVLEFNVRLGDPETQVLMLLLKSDLVELLMAAAEGKLDTVQPEWHTDRYAVCVVLAAPGYPGATYTRGIRIHGLTEAASISGVQIFNAGIAYQGGQLVSTGGRVLSVCATGASIPEALQKAYSAVDTIWSLPALHYRTDIGIKALQPPTFL